MLGELIDETLMLARRYPQIVALIHADQDRLALEKKQLRLEHEAWLRRRTEPLPGLESVVSPGVIASALQQGRPRMDPESVLVFFVIAHYFNSVYSATAVERLFDSLSVYQFLVNRGMNMPGMRTIGDNVNAVSQETRRYILQCQMQLALAEELEDFNEVYGDSTSCEANTRWPTDSGLIHRLLNRTFRDSQTLDRFGLPNLRVHWMEQWLPKLKQLDFAINVAKNNRERKKLYRKYLKTSGKATLHLGNELLERFDAAAAIALPPLLRQRLDQRYLRMMDDLLQVCRIHDQCERRVLEGKRVRGSERILSLSDRAAAYILKGDRCPVVGYKPQVIRSRQGLITALLVPEGNAADSEMLEPLVREAIELTGVVPRLGSFDDGYTSAAGLAKLQQLGLQDVSFSGSKGKALLGDDQWASDVLSDARRNRSAVESLIFCLKHCLEFGELRRRGIEAVRDELLGKAIVYNFCRIILLRKRKQEREPQNQAA